jgi:hypothetical protein
MSPLEVMYPQGASAPISLPFAAHFVAENGYNPAYLGRDAAIDGFPQPGSLHSWP